MTKFSTIIIEAFCTRKWSMCKDKYYYKIIDFDNYKTKKVPNPHYDPKYKTPKKPKYCPMSVGKESPTYVCLEKNCPHLGYGDADKAEYLWDNKYWKNKK